MIDKRVTRLEQDLSLLQTDLAVIKSNYVTREDVSNAKNTIVVWVVGAIFLGQLLPSLLLFFKNLA